MATYKKTILVHGAPVTIDMACPYDGLTQLTFPVYLNHYALSGLPQPYGPINNNNNISVSGIVRPASFQQADPSAYVPYAPSGLARTHIDSAAQGTDGFGFNQVTNYLESNWYQNYWTCPNKHFFIYPSGVGSEYPIGSQVGNISNVPPCPFGNFE